MPYTKRRVRQHIMEDQSVRIVREVLPEEWVVREYKPDYGIDLSVEIFEFLDEERSEAATLGETLFVQIKSTEVVRPRTRCVHARGNVELGALREDRAESVEIEVAALQLETSELLTVQAMGSAVPVLLFLVELSTRRVYFVCLNDLVEKVILPGDPTYHLKDSKVIHVPLANCIVPGHPVSLLPLGTFAKRSKLYAAFAKFGYQRHEIELAVERYNGSAPEVFEERAASALVELIRHFLAIDLRYDFWTRIPEWQSIAGLHRKLLALNEFLQDPGAIGDAETLRAFLLSRPGYHNEPYFRVLPLLDLRAAFLTDVLFTWRALDNLSGMYEELVREWFLPTFLSTLLCEDLRQ
jgi:hypothetical protein